MSDFVPPSPQSISLRPLTKGMVSNSVEGEDGAKRIRNLVVQPSGPERRPAWTPLFGDKTSYGRMSLEEGEVVQDIVPYWAADGSFMYVAITNKRLWKLTSLASTWERIPFTDVSRTATAHAANSITDSSATFITDGVRAGDAVRVIALVESPTADITLNDTGGTAPTINYTNNVINVVNTADGFSFEVSGISSPRVGYEVGSGTILPSGDYHARLRLRALNGANRTLSPFVVAGTSFGFPPLAVTVGTWIEFDRAISITAPITQLLISVSNVIGDQFEVDYLSIFPYVDGAETSVTITSVFSETVLLGTFPSLINHTFSIEHRFSPAEGVDLVDFTQTPAYLVLTDNTVGGIVKFDGSTVTAYGAHAAAGDPDADYLQAARTVLYFAGRMWLGCTTEAGSDGRRFTRWSSLTDITEFAAIDYVDFYGEDSSVLKLSSNEDAPIVYLENAIYVGYPSSLEGLPYAFVRVERGSISLAGPHAIASAGGGQFFVSSDNFYFLSTGRQGTTQAVSCEPIGTKIVNEAVEIAPSLLRAQVFYDKLKELVYFVLPTATGRVWRIFVSAMRTKAWSYFDTPADTFVALASLPTVLSSADWTDLDAETWSDENGVSWSAFITRISQASICAIDVNGVTYTQSRNALNDTLVQGDGATLAENAIAITFESGDLDFGTADADKVVTRVAVEVDNLANIERSDDVTFDVALSDDHGRTWVDKGNLTIETEANEDEVHFRFRADTFRVKIESSVTPPLSLNNVVLRARPGEVHNVRD